MISTIRNPFGCHFYISIFQQNVFFLLVLPWRLLLICCVKLSNCPLALVLGFIGLDGIIVFTRTQLFFVHQRLKHVMFAHLEPGSP